MNLNNIPIRQQLIIIIMFTSLIGFSLTNALFLYRDYAYTKKEITERLHVLAQIIASRTTAAIEFNDHELAFENLASLSSDSAIEQASIHFAGNNLFAKYSRAGIKGAGDAHAYLFGGHISVTEPIMLNGERIGTLSLASNQSILENRFNEHMYTGGLIFILIFLLTYIISLRVQKVISEPIGELTDIAKKITLDKNYSHRAKRQGSNEVGILVASFNSMLDNLQSAQGKLKNMNTELEKKVALKTKQLQEVNDSLEKKVEEEVRKNSEKDQLLFQQSKMASMGEMIGNIAHQWRQPLNALSLIIGNIQDAFDFGKLDEASMQRSTKKAYMLIEKMSATIDDFRNFFSPDKEKQKFDPDDMIEETLSLIDASLKHHGINVIHERQSGMHITGYKNELSQVILNIINNAKDALVENKTENPRLSISTCIEENSFGLRIKDNAGGIPETIIARVFEPYFTTKHQTQGTGIGLYMSKLIIEEHMHGSLNVVNDDEGAVFTITLDQQNN